jgi:hypothetical protein
MVVLGLAGQKARVPKEALAVSAEVVAALELTVKGLVVRDGSCMDLVWRAERKAEEGEELLMLQGTF